MKNSSMVLAASVFAAGSLACGDSVKTVKVEPATTVMVTKDGAPPVLKASPLDGEGKLVINALTQITWSSSDPGVVAVEQGKLSAKKSGEVTITAAVGDVKGTAKATVSIPGKIVLSPVQVMLPGVGKTSTLSVTVEDELGKPVKAADVPITWSTSEGNVAVVEGDGRVKAVGAGEATITATFKAAKGDATVTVKLPQVAKLELTPTNPPATPVNQLIQLKATPLDSSGAPILGYFAAWSSANDKVAKVASDGEVTLLKKGKTRIKASIGTVSGEIEVTAK